MSTKREKRFDHLWHETVEVAYKALLVHARLTDEHVREYSRNAYRFGKGLLEMHKHHRDELIAMVKSEGKTLTDWEDEHFETIERFKQTRERLLAAIEAGVTEAQWVDRADTRIASKRIRAAEKAIPIAGKEIIPEVRGAASTTDEQVVELEELVDSARGINKGLRVRIRALKKALQVAKQERAYAEARLEERELVITRLKNDLGGLASGRTVKTSH